MSHSTAEIEGRKSDSTHHAVAARCGQTSNAPSRWCLPADDAVVSRYESDRLGDNRESTPAALTVEHGHDRTSSLLRARAR